MSTAWDFRRGEARPLGRQLALVPVSTMRVRRGKTSTRSKFKPYCSLYENRFKKGNPVRQIEIVNIDTF